ncbi:unnamed protein product [Lactuca virosa]|uniref:tRNA-specific 2-thiouridylase MnmA-like C-terminal domain-containing protein n=1 Tax=Lactuca virosa TaxID=75947 RepID=A0AAU9PYK3_9ASTR|nr:unnamed protein product [Lactuca virosa]
MLRTTMATLFHPTTKLYSLPLKAFVLHSLRKPQWLINRQSYPRADRTILSINTPRSLSSTAVPQISNDTTSYLDNSYLSCSMLNSKRPLKIAVLLSGGVDSSVALRLLHAAGHSCNAFYLKIWFQEDFQNFWSECPWEEDLKYAKAVCNQVSYLIDEYKCGCTPNPDVLCNTRFKIGAFMDAISNMDFEFVASGHYAKVIHALTDETNELLFLQLSKDMDEVRRLARKFDLPNQERRDSQGICFLGKVRHGPFFYDCSLHIEEKDGIGTVQLPEDDQGFAAGQFAAFYQQELCVGSGVIFESWYDAMGFPVSFSVSVSDKSRHIAKMEDKSKLGKPVKIKPKPQDCLRDSIC